MLHKFIHLRCIKVNIVPWISLLLRTKKSLLSCDKERGFNGKLKRIKYIKKNHSPAYFHQSLDPKTNKSNFYYPLESSLSIVHLLIFRNFMAVLEKTALANMFEMICFRAYTAAQCMSRELYYTLICCYFSNVFKSIDFGKTTAIVSLRLI